MGAIIRHAREIEAREADERVAKKLEEMRAVLRANGVYPMVENGKVVFTDGEHTWKPTEIAEMVVEGTFDYPEIAMNNIFLRILRVLDNVGE